jgi:hypothetical protein
MKKTAAILSILLFMGIISANAQSTGAPKGSKLLRHVVLVKFKQTSSAEDISKVEKAFAGLSKSISLIKAFEWGTNNSPENLNQELTHCFFATFSSEKDRDDYLVHPKHKEFVSIAGPHFDKVTVVDYWVK